MAKFGGAVGATAQAIYDPTNSQPHGGVCSGIGAGAAASDGDNYANQRIGGTSVNFKVEKANGDGVAPAITADGALTAGNVGDPYTEDAVVATGGFTPYFFYVSVGALPPGLNMNSATGEITGTPTAEDAEVAFSVTVQDNEGNTDIGAYTIAVTAT